ncbi:MAG: proline--tRNA ligase [Candidatus Dadabacteria bacterium]|nr:proline--tRNA ligase [Candidatus Dadabacteria bacterium]NIQ12927.1 proline--tRNA ligase [Candidatus Dadabacteria bacterium]
MRYSKYFLPTLRDNPSDAEVVSHQLMVRAGMIRKIAAGIYNYLPLGLKSIKKVENIVREEMNRAGAIELLMPAVLPAELWIESKRWDYYGKELLRFKDRAERDFCIGPTHEEIITDIVRKEIRSYKQLPVNLYQIQTKFRDEIRPRFGVMRAREFIMKDAYSFDATDEGADKSYQEMYEAYNRIFERCGLEFKAVQADTGNIGGNFSHEFMVLADTGEDVIMSSTETDYTANLELAEIGISEDEMEGMRSKDGLENVSEIHTPELKTVEEVAEFMNVKTGDLIKTLIVQTDKEVAAALVRGDSELSLTKLRKVLDADFVELATPEVINEVTGGPMGFSGPVGLNKIKVVADKSIRNIKNAVTGANKGDYHISGVNPGRDFEADIYGDIRVAVDGDPCPVSKNGVLKSSRGIEVGHVFKLGTKYSEAMGAVYTDENGKEKPIIMGCYGIGIGRTVAAAIEQNNDDFGIKFPTAIAPFEVSLLPLNVKQDDVRSVAEEIYKQLKDKNVDILIDDRTESAGIKFKDADLLGIPFQITVGQKGLKENSVEIKDRMSGEKIKVGIDEVVSKIESLLNTD